MPEKGLDDVRAELQRIPWDAIRRNKWTSVESIHEKIKSDLQYHGIKRGFQVFPEFDPEPDNNSHQYRIDVGWFDREQYEPQVAFEIDGGVSQHSVKKLQKLPDDVDKVIISKSPNQTTIRRGVEEDLPQHFTHIDVEIYK